MLNLLINIIVCLITLAFINLVLSKNKILIDKPEYSNHKFDHQKVICLSGGIYFFVSFFIISNIHNYDTKNLLFYLPFLLVGIIADLKKSFSPNLRLILQIIIFVYLINILNLKVSSVDLTFFDALLENNLFNIFFVVFCLITVLNGHNFMDGLNGFVVGNFLLILFSIMFILNNIDLNYNVEFILFVEILIVTLFIFFVFNISGLCFLGDNGIYVYSSIISIIIINFIEMSDFKISPILAVAYLWYPAFENLFSIIRRIIYKLKISDPDTQHLHTLLNSYLSIKLKKKYSFMKINSLSGFVINIALLPNFLLSTIWFDKSFNLMILVSLQILIYLIIYIQLKNNSK